MISSIQFIEDLGCIVTSSIDSTVKVFFFYRSFRIISLFPFHLKIKLHLSLMKFLAVDTLEELACFSDHKKSVNCVAWCSKSLILATAGEDHCIILYNAITLRKLGVLLGHKNSIFSLTCDDQNQHLISLSSDETIRICDIRLISIYCYLFNN
jgi:WD40 repeat protein